MKVYAREMVPIDRRHEDTLAWTSYFSSGLHFFKNMMCHALGGFCHLYLHMILLMRSGDVETNPGPESVTQEQLDKIAREFPHSHYISFSYMLGTEYNAAQAILVKHGKDYHLALMEILMAWKTRTGGPYTQLMDALRNSGAGDLVELVEPDAPVTPPGSETQPLSPELIKRCAEDFKLKYRTTLCKIRADPLDPDSLVQFEDMYTNLDLEEEHRKSKRPLEYEELFNLKVNGEFPRRLVVQGEAGAGKTTFCAKIAWDWINGSSVLPPYVWTIIVSLREAEQYTIGEIAKSYLTKENPATAHQITEYIRSHQKEVFIAFDGLDEFRGKLVKQGKGSSKSECAQSLSTAQMQLPSVPSAGASVQPSSSTSEACGSPSKRGAITSILRSDELAACPVLVTGRPWKVSEIRWDNSLRKLYTFIHVEGFNKENVKVYIHKYFQDDEARADQLIQLIHGNDIILGNMAPYPMYIAMLCLMWRESDVPKREKLKSFQTFSQIFEEMIDFLKVHHAQKVITDLGSPAFTHYRKQIERLMQPVAKLAFTGLQENTLVFKEDDFQHCSESMESACRVGVLSQEKRLISIHDKSNEYLQSAVFFPHKLFQEYMAGVHFASLYESNRNEFNRLLEEVVLPRKKELRYLLYFAVSRNKAIANHVMKCLVQDNIEEKDINLLVGIAFESQDQDVAALLRDRVSSQKMELSIFMKTARSAASYIFTGIYAVSLQCCFHQREWGPTMSHDVAEMICSSPSLKELHLTQVSFHDDFFEVLAKGGKKCKVWQLMLYNVKFPTPASSQNLAEALCSMPNLTFLRLFGMDPGEEFYSTLNANASTLHVCRLRLFVVKCPTPASSQNLAEALCSMPNLTELILWRIDPSEEFYSALNAKGSTLHICELHLTEVKCRTPASSQNLAEALCSMPHLNNLILYGLDPGEEFYSALNAKGSTLHARSLGLTEVKCRTPASSQNLAEALCSMPHLNDLELHKMDPGEEFYSALNAKGSTLHVQTLSIDIRCPTPASSQNLVEALCSMPNLTDLTLRGENLSEEFYSALKTKASTLQVKSISLDGVKCPTPAASQNLAEALCSMPNLNVLALEQGRKLYGNELDLHEEFYFTLNAEASLVQARSIKLDRIKCPTPAASQNLAKALCSMPNLTDLNMMAFDSGLEVHEGFFFTLNSMAPSMQVRSVRLDRIKCPTPAASQNLAKALCFMPNLTDLTMQIFLGRLELHEDFYFTLNAIASSMKGCFPHISRGDFRFNGTLQENLDSFLHSLADFQRDHPQTAVSWQSDNSSQESMSDVEPSYHSQQQPMGDVQPSDHSQQQPMGDVQPSDHSQQQPMGNVQPRYHSQQQPMGNVQPWYHSQQQPVGNVQSWYHPQQQPGGVVQQRYHSQQQPMGDVQPSDHPQQQPGGDVQPRYHSQRQPMGNVQPSDHPQQQPMGNVQPSDHSQQQPMDDVQLSDHSQQQPIYDVHSSYQVHQPTRTPQRLDQSHQQTILGTLPQDTKDQFFQSPSGGCSSSTRSQKRQAPCTQTTAPEDTSAIPKKQVRAGTLK